MQTKRPDFLIVPEWSQRAEFAVKNEILLVEPMMSLIEDRRDAAYRVHRLYKTGDGAALGSIRAVVTGGGTGLSNEWIERLPSLGLTAVNGVGTDKVDLGFARSRNVHVSTTPGVLTDDVADTGIALLLGVLRHVALGDRFVREGRWAGREAFPLGVSPKGKRIGMGDLVLANLQAYFAGGVPPGRVN